MTRSQAHVATDRPHRYAKQLASHFGHKIETHWDDEAGRGSLSFGFGTAEMTAAPDVLLLVVEGADDDLDRLEGVVGRHLVRFGAKDELVTAWHRADGSPGTVQRHEEDSEKEAASERG